MKRAKRFLSVLLTLCMVLGMLPGTVFAANSSIPFTDVKKTDWFYEAVQYAYENDMMSGTGDTTFSPSTTTTRGMIVTILHRMEGKPSAAGETFTDVAAGQYYADAVAWASANGIVSGYGNGKFGPNNTITREQFAAIVYRYANLKGYDTTARADLSKFSDAGDISDYAVDALAWANAVGLVNGTSDTTISPTGSATRAQAAAILSRFCKEVINEKPQEEQKPQKPSAGGSSGGYTPPAPATYTLSFAQVENGEINSTVAGNYSAGTQVNLTATPAEGYAFVEWTSDNGGIFENAFSKSTTFTMPSHNVVISVAFLKETEVIPEEVSAFFGLNPAKTDNDDDGLSDYVEIYYSFTDPLLADSDANGILDADEDADHDGLTNKYEVELGTDLSKEDSDNDGLTDYEEINVYDTNPCQYDTDGDGLSDGDEILLGLNPLVIKTDGTTVDSEREFTQNVNSENISELLLDDSNAAIPSLVATASGNINRSIFIEMTDSNDFTDSRAIVGEPIDITGGDISEGTLSFKIGEGVEFLAVEDTGETFNTKLICKYNEDGSTEYLETEYNAETGTVSAQIDGSGTYFVMDVNALFEELGLALPSVSSVMSLEDEGGIMLMSDENEINENQSSQKNEGIAFWGLDGEDPDIVPANRDAQKMISLSSAAMAQADIVFIIDTTGSMGDEITNVKNNINAFVDALKAKGISAALALIDYQDITHDGYDSTRVHKNGASNWFYDVNIYKEKINALYADDGGDAPECAVDALETARLLDMRASAGKIFILVTDAEYKIDNRYGIPSMASEIELLKNAGVSCSVVTSSYQKSTYYNLYNETGGIWANINGNFNTELLAIADKIGDTIVGDGFWVYLEGPVPVPVRLDEMPSVDSTADTDRDGRLDRDELESTIPTGELDLDELITKVSHGAITGTDYGIVKMYKYKSNPVEKDTDFDGISDKEDNEPRDNSFAATLYDGIEEGINVEYKVDYRYLIKESYSNTQYNQELAALGAVYATMAYGSDIKFTKGITTEKIKIDETFKNFGLSNVIDYKLTDGCWRYGIPAYSDDDISEVIVGHRQLEYNGSQHEVIVCAVRGTNATIEEWSSNFDVGADDSCYDDYSNEEWTHRYHHKGFDVVSNRIKVFLDYYVNEYVNQDAKKSIFIVGHSRGGAITNILGSYYEDDRNYDSYAYGFATPNTTTSDNYSNYKTIFSVVNEDDIVPCLPLEAWGFHKYGTVKSASVKDKYENKWFGAQKGTWEWLINANRTDKKLDYNFNGNKENTVKAFNKLIKIEDSAEKTRMNLYKYPTKDYTWICDVEYATADEAFKAKETVLNDYGTRISKYANIRVMEVTKGVFSKKTVYQLYVDQYPAFATMVVADLAAGSNGAANKLDINNPVIENIAGQNAGIKVANAYHNAKFNFVWSGIDSTGEDGQFHFLGVDTRLGGMTHGHWPITYYLLARYEQ